jgi:hypothetical protein
VKKEMNGKDGTIMTEFRIPSAAELYALEQLARRERAKALAALVGGGAAWLKRAFVAVFTQPYAPRPKAMRHA